MEAISPIAKKPPQELLDEIQKISPEKINPYNPQTKKELIMKWQSGTLTLPEAQQLQKILQEDTRIATGEEIAAILLALVLIAALIYLLSQE